MKQKSFVRDTVKIILLFMSLTLLLICSCDISKILAFINPAAIAESIGTEGSVNTNSNTEFIAGKVYTFGKDNAYQFSSSNKSENSADVETYGSLSISGIELSIDTNASSSGVTAYSIPEGHVSIKYSYSDELLSASDEEWHLVDDTTTAIDVFKISNNIQKGAIILQKSMDHLNWYDLSVQTNVFANTPVQDDILYETTDIEMINGYYYRLIVVYETARKIGTSTVALVFSQDNIEYKRTAEVYEFYISSKNAHIEPINESMKRYSLGETTLVSDFASYSGAKEITKDDLHYGWKLGEFFVSGFTSSTGSKDNVVFLKNAGDVITLWFNLTQNISALNNDASLSITSDSDGHDRFFQTPTTNFGKGMLIIRYTDHENIRHNTVMYHDYLLANTMMGANTRVQLFEEGDYEVALDYEVTKSQLIPQVHHYRIFFRFSVRNANCMVYPFDVLTGAELTNGSVTENGFSLDLARSRYLNLYIKKEIWMEGADGLTEDTRFNTTAKDGDCYTDEGIYTITAKNQYTGIETAKKIYVGTNRILAAYASSNYSIAEIQRMVEQGATIYEDGTIVMPYTALSDTVEPMNTPLSEPISAGKESSSQPHDDSRGSAALIPIIAAIASALIAAFASYQKVRKSKEKAK